MVKQENINVVARVRPFSEWIGSNRKSCLHIDPNGSSITVKTTSKEPKFDVNQVFDENTPQEAIFTNVGQSIIDGFLDGINGTIFAYGQTGSGKTYTMLGPDVDGTVDPQNHGIIPRAIESIFEVLNDRVAQNPDTFTISMKCSFLELYNEKLYDLLQTNDATIKIHSSLEQITVVGAAEFEVTTYEECMEHLWRGWNQRKVAETSMNRESSRSHAVFMLTLVTEHAEGTVVNRRSSRLNLVDLAGSERQGQTNNTGVHLKEAGNINKSLSILARVIRTLAALKPNQYIPYRDSLLTHLLRDSLGGNARTTVVVNIHPNSQFVGDTISTLNFAVNVKKVKNSAHVNEAISSDDIKSWSAEIGRLRKENGELKAEKSDVMKENENLSAENQKLHETITSLQSQVTSYLNRSARRTTGFAAILEEDGETDVPRKINFDEEADDGEGSYISTLSNEQRKKRRQTQFISRPVQPPTHSELQKKLAETEKALDEEEKMRSESELQVNSLFQIINDKNERIRQLEAAENESIKKVLEVQSDVARLEKHIEEQVEQINQLKERQNADADIILSLEEDREALESKLAEMEYEIQKLGSIKDDIKETKESGAAMKLEIIELEKQRDEAQRLLAENTGHKNHSQKIHLLENMKNEMKALKSENAHLRSIMKAKGLHIPEKENKAPSTKHRK